MIYALAGSLLLGALSTVYLLWRKSQVETELAKTNDDLHVITVARDGWQISYKLAADQRDRKDAEIKTLQTERDNALKQLETSGAPGALTDILRTQATGSSPNKS